MKFCYLYPLLQKMKRWIDVFFFFIGLLVIYRDWRGSNPQLPPWQGGALTNWTTIPGKRNTAYIFFWFHSNTFCLDFKLESSRCNRVRVVGKIDIHTHIYFIYILVILARITSYLFVISNKSLFQIKIAKSIDNQPFNKKKKKTLFSFYFFSFYYFFS